MVASDCDLHLIRPTREMAVLCGLSAEVGLQGSFTQSTIAVSTVCVLCCAVSHPTRAPAILTFTCLASLNCYRTFQLL